MLYLESNIYQTYLKLSLERHTDSFLEQIKNFLSCLGLELFLVRGDKKHPICNLEVSVVYV